MGWLILAAVILLILVLLVSSAALYVACENGEFTLTARYLFLKFPLSLEKKEKGPPKAKPQKKTESKKKEPPKEKTPLSQSIRLIWDLVQAAAQDLGILLSKLRLCHFTLRLTLAEEDAAQTGIRYGQTCAYVYSGLALVQGLMKVRKVGKIELTPDFQAEAPRTDYFFSFCLKLRMGSLLRAALRILFRFLLRTAKRQKVSSPPAENSK